MFENNMCSSSKQLVFFSVLHVIGILDFVSAMPVKAPTFVTSIASPMKIRCSGSNDFCIEFRTTIMLYCCTANLAACAAMLNIFEHHLFLEGWPTHNDLKLFITWHLRSRPSRTPTEGRAAEMVPSARITEATVRRQRTEFPYMTMD